MYWLPYSSHTSQDTKFSRVYNNFKCLYKKVSKLIECRTYVTQTITICFNSIISCNYVYSRWRCEQDQIQVSGEGIFIEQGISAKCYAQMFASKKLTKISLCWTVQCSKSLVWVKCLSKNSQSYLHCLANYTKTQTVKLLQIYWEMTTQINFLLTQIFIYTIWNERDNSFLFLHGAMGRVVENGHGEPNSNLDWGYLHFI